MNLKRVTRNFAIVKFSEHRGAIAVTMENHASDSCYSRRRVVQMHLNDASSLKLLTRYRWRARVSTHKRPIRETFSLRAWHSRLARFISDVSFPPFYILLVLLIKGGSKHKRGAYADYYSKWKVPMHPDAQMCTWKRHLFTFQRVLFSQRAPL